MTSYGNPTGIHDEHNLHQKVSKATLVQKGAKVSCPVTVCIFTTCFFWIPLIFWLAAANVLPSCEKELELFMRVYGLYTVLNPIALVTLLSAVALYQKSLYYFFEALVAVVGFCCTTSLVIWGFVTYLGTTDAMCYNADAELDHHINPRTLCIVFVIFGLLGIAENCGRTCKAVNKYSTGECRECTSQSSGA